MEKQEAVTIKTNILKLPIGPTLKIVAPALPQTKTDQQTRPLVAVNDTLRYKLDQVDNTFSYRISSTNKETLCATSNEYLECPLSPLNLSQGAQYRLKIVRKLNTWQAGTLTNQEIQTVSPLTVTNSSIVNNATVLDTPKQIVVTLDKQIDKIGRVKLISANTEIPINVAKDGNKLFIDFKSPLPRGTQFEMLVDGATATDHSYLIDTYKTRFTTSNGPKVTSVNIGQNKIDTNPTIRLTFDMPIQQNNIQNFISLSNNQINAVSTTPNSVTFRLARPLNLCEQLTINISDKLENIYGVNGKNAWSYSSRAICGTSFSIGNSVEGRPITAWQFGSGTSTVLYVGATHGNELSSKIILDAWINYLQTNAHRLPANRKIVIIPVVNPDGVARGSRLNANNVDLNRNFPANNWKPDITIPGGQLVINGGGTSSLSEPEAALLASFTQGLSPRAVLTYHSQASLITANESGDSMGLASTYGSMARYRSIGESNLGNTFNYDTTGAYENWLHDKLGIPTLLIELPNHTSQFFGTNQSAMWFMANL